MNYDKERELFEVWRRNHERRENRAVREDEIADYFIERMKERDKEHKRVLKEALDNAHKWFDAFMSTLSQDNQSNNNLD